jgi:hypothetical protein
MESSKAENHYSNHMGRSERPKTRLSPVPVQVQFREIDAAFTGQVVVDSDCSRVTIPRRECKMWDILPGDEIAVRIIRLKREPA